MSNLQRSWHKLPKAFRVVAYIIFGAIAVAVMGFVFGWVIQLLWNWLMPELFHLKEITYWQAIGIFILARFIFGFGGSNSSSKESSSKKSKVQIKRDNVKAHSKWHQWEYYDEWWEQEGKKAFDDYLNTKREDSTDSTDKDNGDSSDK